MPLIPSMHSSKSDGFSTARGYHAVFHDFDECGYHRRIARDGNSSQGIGHDNMGRRRDLCQNCRRLWASLFGPQGQGPI